MSKVIYEKIHGDPLLYTTICLQLVDQLLCYPKGILEDVYVWVGYSYVPVDFMVVETGGDERSLIILGWPFLSTAKAIIYADSAKICFTIKDAREKFTFKNHTLQSSAHPQRAYIYEDKIAEKKNNWRRKNKTRQPQQESVKMINIVKIEYDHHLTSPFLVKKDDPGVPTIKCTIEQVFRVSYFHKQQKLSVYLASSPKIVRRKVARVARFSKDRDLKKW
jgi:hypothetical protein